MRRIYLMFLVSCICWSCSGPQTVAEVDGVKIVKAVADHLQAGYAGVTFDGVLTVSDLVKPVLDSTEAGLYAGGVDPQAIVYYSLGSSAFRAGLGLTTWGKYVLGDDSDTVFKIVDACTSEFLAALKDAFEDYEVTVLEWVQIPSRVIRVGFVASGKWDVEVPKATGPGATWGSIFEGAVLAAEGILAGPKWGDIVTLKSTTVVD